MTAQVNNIVELYRDDTIHSPYDFSNILKEDVDILYDGLQNLKKLYNNFLGQEGLDPLITVTSREGTTVTLGSALISKWQKYAQGKAYFAYWQGKLPSICYGI